MLFAKRSVRRKIYKSIKSERKAEDRSTKRSVYKSRKGIKKFLRNSFRSITTSKSSEYLEVPSALPVEYRSKISPIHRSFAENFWFVLVRNFTLENSDRIRKVV